INQLHNLIEKTINQTNYPGEKNNNEQIYSNKLSYTDLASFAVAVTLLVSMIYVLGGKRI
ncbi:MAG: hypothetical protein J7L82_04720, partial [Staphylothermus sp.]|nr:hypothetical protein [Staphylothermus sp.]